MDTIKGWMECSWHVNCNMNIDPNVNNHEINVCVSNKRHVNIIIIQESNDSQYSIFHNYSYYADGSHSLIDMPTFWSTFSEVYTLGVTSLK